MKIKPLADRVLVEIEVIQEKSKGGLFIPQTAQEKSNTTGKVVALGNDVEKDILNIGDMVMFDQYSGTSIKDAGKEYLLVSFADILAVIS